ncbi:DDE superfamily endonuclease [Popillia japonica]|uniref:DDE superfamily endonuclease n=1 Tax=Popillia japonica TaxID=7064 RepID=A0AAW1MCB1_POPJA
MLDIQVQYMMLQYGRYQGYFMIRNSRLRFTGLLGDSGYTLQPWLFAPIVGAAPNTPEAQYTRRHATVSNTVERYIGLLKTRFRYGSVAPGKIIYACAILHNIALYGNIALSEIQLANEKVPVDGVGEDDGHHEASFTGKTMPIKDVKIQSRRDIHCLTL